MEKGRRYEVKVCIKKICVQINFEVGQKQGYREEVMEMMQGIEKGRFVEDIWKIKGSVFFVFGEEGL